MPSTRWRAAKREVDGLRKQFLPSAFDPLGQYPSPTDVRANTRAFVVFAHAEIESYLEESAKSLAQAAERLWQKQKRFSSPLGYLAACLGEQVRVPSSPIGPKSRDVPQLFDAAAVKLFQRYYGVISKNHGIKESNVIALYAPLGLPLSTLGSTLLPNLTSFGSIRGDQVHHSAQAVVSVLDPGTEYRRALDLLTDLLHLDSWVGAYRKTIR